MDEDEWVENTYGQKNAMPVEKKNDPAEIIEINARLYEVQEVYQDLVLSNLKSDRKNKLSLQDKNSLSVIDS